jgi:hypothetical protein
MMPGRHDERSVALHGKQQTVRPSLTLASRAKQRSSRSQPIYIVACGLEVSGQKALARSME